MVVVTGLLLVEWVLLLVTQPGVALAAGGVWLIGRFVWPAVKRV